MGFRRDTDSQSVQVLMFSATSTEASEETAKKWLRKPERVHVGTSAANISSTVVQSVQVCNFLGPQSMFQAQILGSRGVAAAVVVTALVGVALMGGGSYIVLYNRHNLTIFYGQCR